MQVLHYRVKHPNGWRYAVCGRTIKPARIVDSADRVTCCDCLEWLAEAVAVGLALAEARAALHAVYDEAFDDG